MELTITARQGAGSSAAMGSGTVGLRAQLDAGKSKALERTAAQLYHDGKYTKIEQQQPMTPPSAPDRYEGKTIVENRPFGGITVSSIYGEDGRIVTTPSDANKRAMLGAPTHGFFYHDTDFLFDAAKEYSVLGENEIFRHRNIYDIGFIRDTLDLFTNGGYTEEDVALMERQMEHVVLELAQQVKKGESPDLSKLQSRLTVGGADVSIAQLLEFQKIGKELEGAFDTVTVGQLQTQKYAQMGIAKAVGSYYGSGRGQIGEMFSSAIDRLYDKGVAMIRQTYSAGAYQIGPWNQRQEDAVKVGLDIAQTLSKLDTSSKDHMIKDFSARSAAIRQMVQKHCDRFGVMPSHLGLAGDMAGLTKYFEQWMEKV